MTCSFVVPLRPKAKERPRHRGNIAYTPKATKEYEEAVKHYYKRDVGEPATKKPVMITLMFNFMVPKCVKGEEQRRKLLGQCPYSARPDLDNIEKAIMDGLNGVAFEDDSQVVAKISLKRYWKHDSVMITIEEMEDIDYEHGVFSGYGAAE